MKKISNEEVQEAIDILQGTCDTLDGAIQETTGNDELGEDDLTSEQHNLIDNQIFLCTECNWWCEISEQAEDDNEPICQDCFDVL